VYQRRRYDDASVCAGPSFRGSSIEADIRTTLSASRWLHPNRCM